jgi:hypothetical protein
MEQLGHPTLVAYTSVTEMEQGKRPRLVRGRSLAYAALLVGLVVTGGAMVVGRVPFEATVNRAPGSLFTIDADGYVRNTYLLKVTNNDPSSEPVAYRVRVEGLERAEVVAPPMTLGPSESRTTPLVIRVPLDDSLQRTIRIRVYIASPKGELVRDVTFKTGSDVGAVGAKG